MAKMVIVALAEDVGSVTEVAVSVIVAGLGTFAVAVYVMVAPEALNAVESVPQAMPVQPAPESVQTTPLF